MRDLPLPGGSDISIDSNLVFYDNVTGTLIVGGTSKLPLDGSTDQRRGGIIVKAITDPPEEKIVYSSQYFYPIEGGFHNWSTFITGVSPGKYTLVAEFWGHETTDPNSRRYCSRAVVWQTNLS